MSNNTIATNLNGMVRSTVIYLSWRNVLSAKRYLELTKKLWRLNTLPNSKRFPSDQNRSMVGTQAYQTSLKLYVKFQLHVDLMGLIRSHSTEQRPRRISCYSKAPEEKQSRTSCFVSVVPNFCCVYGFI